ncbi:ervatamin-B-like [Harmonia axyridis]|uniref:ervatamin-B-like n=1 Tax=Harmonia axyridis TaxID=115357 RepID=UPI001E2781DB|nr:ervatamin-B-like [Harmonia axyridis]
MNKLVLLFTLFLEYTITLGDRYYIEEKWNQFLNMNNKKYEPWDSKKRFEIFTKNMHMMEAHNKRFLRGSESFKMDIGPFSDQTEEEFMLKFETHTSPFRSSMEHAEFNSFVENHNERLPNQVDYRNKMQPAKDQKNCKASWAFAAVAVVEGMSKLRFKQDISLSEQNLVDCALGNEFMSNGCEGGSPWGALLYMKLHGIDTSQNYPYTGVHSRCRSISNSSVHLKSPHLMHLSEYDLMRTVGATGPVATTIEVTPTLMHYKSGIVFDRKCVGKTTNHAVTIVGYGVQDGFQYWLVRNSWGHNWGDQGYFKMARNYGNNCQIGISAFFADVSQ